MAGKTRVKSTLYDPWVNTSLYILQLYRAPILKLQLKNNKR